MVSYGSTKGYKRLKQRSLSLTGPGGSSWHSLRGYRGAGRERGRTWAHTFIRFSGWNAFGVPVLRPDWSI